MFRRVKRQVPDDAAQLFARHVADWAWLTEAERDRLQAAVAELMPTRRWEAARGFELTDAMCAVIAAQIALMCLGFDEEGLAPVDRVQTIIVHPRTITLTGTHRPAPGLVSDEPRHLSGEAHDGHGPLLLAWDAVRRETRHRRRRNVVIHEVAHKLDMLDGVLDGTPPLAEVASVERWARESTAAYNALRSRGDDLIDEYGATDPAEFFAVVSELFFTAPERMAEAHPALYDCYSDFYRQDPAGRRARLQPEPEPQPEPGSSEA